MKIVLAGCVKTKLPGVHRAEDLYDSRLFRGRRSFARANADRWFILSALYGLVPPVREIEWYEQAMTDLSRAERREWSQCVLRDLDQQLGSLAGIEFEIHAGAEYCRWGLVDGLREREAMVTLPLAHMGIGEQLRWYAREGH